MGSGAVGSGAVGSGAVAQWGVVQLGLAQLGLVQLVIVQSSVVLWGLMQGEEYRRRDTAYTTLILQFDSITRRLRGL